MMLRVAGLQDVLSRGMISSKDARVKKLGYHETESMKNEEKLLLDESGCSGENKLAR